MPPKKTNIKKMSDADFDEILASATGQVSTAVKTKEGMTKKQIKEAQEKHQAQAARQRNVPYSDEELRMLLQYQQQQMLQQSYVYTNVPKPLPEAYAGNKWTEVSENCYVRLEQLDENDKGSPATEVTDILSAYLTEPYPDCTYYSFMFRYPDLCVRAYVHKGEKPAEDDTTITGTLVGAIVSNVEYKANDGLVGYVAMLAVIPEYRRFKIASLLARVTVELFKAKGCIRATLETPADAHAAIGLYTALGFSKTAFLTRYYLEGQDAYRLELHLTPGQNIVTIGQRQHAMQAEREKQLQARQQQKAVSA